MSMATTCPDCRTTFRVRYEDLQASRGQVRCGQCSKVFNAFVSLTTLDEAPGDMRDTPRAPPQKTGTRIPSLETRVSGNKAKPFTGAAPEKTERSPAKTAAWIAAILLLLLLLAAQLAYFLRVPLAAYYPETKPYLQRYCEL
ncbi:MAG: DUF3426 domain-containing protein, partial [Burkholderiales bacterium]